MSTTTKTMFESQPAVSELNMVKGFDPHRFLRKTVSERTRQEVLYLDLKYKKLWFRLMYPKGRIKKTALKINEQIAVIEAKIFCDKNDVEPISSFIAQRYSNGRQGSVYIESAQYAAENQALIDAGFGIQFCDVSQEPDAELFDAGIPASGAAMETNGDIPAEESLNDQQAEIIMTATADTKADGLREQDEPPAQQTEAVPAAPALETAQEPQPPESDSAQQTEEIPATAPVEEIQSQQQEETHTQSAATQSQNTVDNTAQADIQAVYEVINGGQANGAAVETPKALGYTEDMPVDDILALMTPDEAVAIVVDNGTCKGWRLADVAEKRPASLKWYLSNGYPGSNNILRAGAKLLLDMMAEQKAS